MNMPSVSHVEWMTSDHDALKDFMHKLFGWEFQPFGPSYFIYIPGGDKASVGIGQRDGLSTGSGTPNVVIEVDSIDVTCEKATTLGGEVVVPKMLISPEMGSSAYIKAPDGNIIGLYELVKR